MVGRAFLCLPLKVVFFSLADFIHLYTNKHGKERWNNNTYHDGDENNSC